jgi:hypothetical protein
MTQYLGELERINAGKTLLKVLFQPGKICYIDGHMIAFWTTVSSQGQNNNAGRIMAGSRQW